VSGVGREPHGAHRIAFAAEAARREQRVVTLSRAAERPEVVRSS
jgi:hypothetical protein